MNNIKETGTRSSFFPKEKAHKVNRNQFRKNILNRNNSERKNELEKYSKSDVKVKISDAIKDFSRMKKVVDATKELDNSEKIAILKEKIKNGSYRPNYEKVADSLLTYEL